MAVSTTTVTLRVRDLVSVRLVAYQLRILERDMRAVGDPYADRLRDVLDRFGQRRVVGGSDDGADDGEPPR